MPAASVEVIVNTADDWWVAGLRIAPDHDSLLYALAGQNDTTRGWGRRDETERVSAELAAWGAGPDWFTLGDLDLGTHIARSSWLRDGVTVSEVYRRLGARWPLGVTLHPATDSEIDTHVVTAEHGRLHFQEWWVRHRAQPRALRFEQNGLDAAMPSDGAIRALATADVVLIAPSNPVVSIGPILAVPGMRDAVLTAGTGRSGSLPAPIVGTSPIIGGAVVRGMADACLSAIGVDTDAAAVARHYGTRAAGGVLDGWLLAEEDAHEVSEVEAAGIACAAVPLWMSDEQHAAAIASSALDLAGV